MFSLCSCLFNFSYNLYVFGLISFSGERSKQVLFLERNHLAIRHTRNLRERRDQQGTDLDDTQFKIFDVCTYSIHDAWNISGH